MTPPAGATILMRVDATAFSTVPNTTQSIEVLIDGIPIGMLDHHFNPINTHLAFAPRTFNLTGLAQGAHTVTLRAVGATIVTDANDRFQVTVEQFPGC